MSSAANSADHTFRTRCASLTDHGLRFSTLSLSFVDLKRHKKVYWSIKEISFNSSIFQIDEMVALGLRIDYFL